MAKMKLSEAISLGATLRPQYFGATRGKVRAGFLGLFKVDATCAWGAAFEAANCRFEMIQDDNSLSTRVLHPAGSLVNTVMVPASWGPVIRHSCACPDCGAGYGTVSHLITHLNDHHRWTRERIAGFVGEVEVMLEEQANATLAAEVLAW